MPPPPQLPFQPGEVCADRYLIEGILGQGGVGVVYSAVHSFTGARVALKALYEPEADLHVRMELEARALATIAHRHVVRVFDGGTTAQGVPWFAMERLDGHTLREWIHGAGLLTLPRAIQFGLEIAAGVGAAHDVGIIHRDLKPENIFVLEPSGEIRVVDFGTARFRRGSIKSTSRMRVLGTYAYMAPERFQGNAGDHRADIYSLGHVLYELVAGRHAFSEGPGPLDLPPVYELGMRQMVAEPRPLTDHRPAVPTELVELVHQMLAKHPDDRPDSMRAVTDALLAARTAWSVVAQDHSEQRKRIIVRSVRGDGEGPGRDPLTLQVDELATTGVFDGLAARGDAHRGDTSPAGTLSSSEGPRWSDPEQAPRIEAGPGTAAAAGLAASHRDWLQHLPPGEYPGCRSLEGQAILGAVRFATRGTPARGTERDLASVLSAPSERDFLPLLQDAAITMTVVTREDRSELRRLMRDWAAALDPEAARVARAAMAARVERARASSVAYFADDALRSTRIIAGASTFPTTHERDPRASAALFALANGTLEDIQLAHFGLLLLIRSGEAEQLRICEAVTAIATGSESARDGARTHLGHLLAASVRPVGLTTARPRTRPSSETVARARHSSPPAAVAPLPVSAGVDSTASQGGLVRSARSLRRPSPLWARPIRVRWLPLILVGALGLGALLTVATQLIGNPRGGARGASRQEPLP